VRVKTLYFNPQNNGSLMMKSFRVIIPLMLLLPLFFLSCQKSELPPNLVRIGSQIWMRKNLDTAVFLNGDSIAFCKNYDEWRQLADRKEPAYTIYGQDTANQEKYGLLYNWYAVSDPRGLAPEGFRIPAEADLSLLLEQCGGKRFRSGRALRSLLSSGHSGFSALYGGWAGMTPDPEMGTDFYMDLGANAAFWSASENDAETAWNLDLGRTVRSDTEGAYLDGSSPKSRMFSLRCIYTEPKP
jgi:uncharacterized protein (TIGR02145 family)